MTDLFFLCLVSGFSVTFSIEVVEALTRGFFGVNILNAVLGFPLSFLAIWVYEGTARNMFLTVPCTAFLAIATSKAINKPNVFYTNGGRR